MQSLHFHKSGFERQRVSRSHGQPKQCGTMGLGAIRAGTEIAANNRHRRIAFLWEVLTQFGIGSPTDHFGTNLKTSCPKCFKNRNEKLK